MVGSNGFSLIGDDIGTQTSLIVPIPESNTLFYIFTIKTPAQDGSNSDNEGLYYSIVDTSLNNGLGMMTQMNVPLIKNVIGKISGVHHKNGNDIWVVVNGKKNQDDLYNDLFFSFLVKPNTIERPVISDNGKLFFSDSVGQMKLSPNGEKLGYVLAGLEGNALQYWFAFFNQAYMKSHSLGKWMMWRTIHWAKTSE